MKCPKCGCENCTSQVFQENAGSVTKTKTKSKYKEKGHGLIWWLCIGWWWWIVDLLVIICAWPLKLIAVLSKKKKYKGKSSSKEVTKNIIKYKKIWTCTDCGHTWTDENKVK